jgi:hypothetical protein
MDRHTTVTRFRLPSRLLFFFVRRFTATLPSSLNPQRIAYSFIGILMENGNKRVPIHKKYRHQYRITVAKMVKAQDNLGQEVK